MGGENYFTKKMGWNLLILGVISGVLLDYLTCWILAGVNPGINIDKVFYYNNSTMFFIAAFGLFLIFKNMNIDRAFQFICIPASTTFGIYLLHDNPLIREYIWKSLELLFPYSQNLVINIVNCFLKVFVIFVVGMVVELIRQFLFRTLKIEKIAILADKVFGKICNMF